MSNMEHVVLGVDGSKSAQRALDWVVAQPSVERITAVHGFSPGQELLVAAFQVNLDPVRAERADNLDGAWTQSVRDSDTKLERTVFVDDDPARALLDTAASAQADAIVIGHRGQSWWDEHHLGHTASKVLHRSDTPVIIVGDLAQPIHRDGPILVGIHGSPDERHQQAEWAMALAGACGAGVHFVAVSEPPAYRGTGYLADYFEIHAADREALDRLVTQYRGQHPRLGISSEVRDGSALEMLLAAATDIDASLLVIGSRHHGSIAGFLTGSVARHLPLLANCPVAAIPMRLSDTD